MDFGDTLTHITLKDPIDWCISHHNPKTFLGNHQTVSPYLQTLNQSKDHEFEPKNPHGTKELALNPPLFSAYVIPTDFYGLSSTTLSRSFS